MQTSLKKPYDLRTVTCVSEWVRGFDDFLDRLLEQCASDAGEAVESFVARAVASQMVAQLRSTDSPALDDLLTHLSDVGVFADVVMPDVSAVIHDPHRLAALHRTGLLDSAPEPIYDRITRAVASALDVPYAMITLIDTDRQFFKSAIGKGGTSLEERQTPLERSMCQYAVATGAPLVLEDARADPTFKHHPAVRDGTVVAYLGTPLMDDTGNAIGTLCVFDTKPRLWSTGHIQVLNDFAALAAERIFGAGATSQQ